MKSQFITLNQVDWVRFRLTVICLSPQKSTESVTRVLAMDIVSLKVYFTRLLFVQPAKLTKFSIVPGEAVMVVGVVMQGLFTVKMKLECVVGGVAPRKGLQFNKVDFSYMVCGPESPKSLDQY